MVTTPFILIGVKDDKGNLLQVVADSGASICAIKESKVVQAEHLILPSQPQMVRLMGKNFVTLIGYCFFSLNYNGNKFTVPCLVFKDEDVFRNIILGNSFMGPRGTLINLLTGMWVTKADNGECFGVPGTYQYVSNHDTN